MLSVAKQSRPLRIQVGQLMRDEPVRVVCVKAKPARYYDHQYVNRLYSMVRRNMTVPFTFTCFTDDATGIKCATRALPEGVNGWWNKLYLFRPGLLNGKVLYLDLDTIIVDSLDFVKDYRGDFAILRDFYRPDGYGSGVMLWNRPQPEVWLGWLEALDPELPGGDQEWLERSLPDADRLQDLFPGKFVSFKDHCTNKIPEGAAAVCFHGEPKPHQLDEDYLVDSELLRHWLGYTNLDQTPPPHVLELLDGRTR